MAQQLRTIIVQTRGARYNTNEIAVIMESKTRIIIAEDQTLVRKGLKSLLSEGGQYDVVGEAEDGLEAIRSVARLKPDLVLLDLAMPRMNGISAIKEIKQREPNTKIVAITFHTSDEYILAAFESGVDGYCLKNDTHANLLLALKRVMAGKRYISPEVSDKILNGYIESNRALKTESAWETLTPREIEILKLVAEGYTSKAIANFLCISPKTADKHRTNIMRKLDLHSAAALAVYALKQGLISQNQTRK
jgi:DNA-binding NarL/FixJ family response regulator